ncbi:Asp23/Gls24 family envelope stress response protein [Corynebacterium tapiri]|uniref:Asp23/Gls24 family envelope stress response protein n=1 Tax=Corynebacterium tapiri TaxID=1448266 RepID=A0A5C4U4V5_9CORY|nr:Asp23/Gls24 family envelope stress response protein [Corynebacterium tapiri]TNL98576.1 Asp23/Gls24 family envelope stress response protein [Corynebacterium tapiri]
MTGTTVIADRIVSRVVNDAASAVPGVQTLTSSWAEIGTKSYPRCDVRQDSVANEVHVDSFIAVSWPSPVTAVAERVQANIVSWVKSMTGMDATRVNVVVEQTIAGHARVSSAELSAMDTEPQLTPVETAPSREITSPVTSSTLNVVSPQTKASERVVMPEYPSEVTVKSPQVAESPEPWSPSVPDEKPVSTPELPRERAVWSPEVPPALSLARVSVPRPQQLKRVYAPRDIAARFVRAPRPIQPYRPSVPAEAPLLNVAIRPYRGHIDPASVQVPRAQRLVPVTVPPEKPLAHIVIRRFDPTREESND